MTIFARSKLAATLGLVFYLGGATQALALLPGQRYYDYYKPSSHPPSLLKSVKYNHLLRAEATLRTRDPNRLSSAAADLRYVLNYFPNHPQALALLVQVGLDAGNRQMVEKYLDDALQTFPDTASTWAIVGTYKARTGQLDEAIESYQRELKLEPYDMQTHYNLGLAYADKKQWSLAMEQADIAYSLGAPHTGLRERLTKAGAWKPSAPNQGKPKAPSQRDTDDAAQSTRVGR